MNFPLKIRVKGNLFMELTSIENLLTVSLELKTIHLTVWDMRNFSWLSVQVNPTKAVT
jgi:hypothetical protein